MSNCPRCGSSSLEEIEDGRYRCLGSVVVSTGALPSGARGPAEAWVRCGYVFVDPGHIGAGASAKVYCECGTFAVGRCVDCNQDKCANHSSLVGSRRLCTSCAATEAAKTEQRERTQRAEAARSRANTESASATEIQSLVDQLIRSDTEREKLLFTTTLATYSGTPIRLEGAEGRRHLREEKDPGVGKFDKLLRKKVKYGNKHWKYTLCSMTGWKVTNYRFHRDGSPMLAELWLADSGVAVQAQDAVQSRDRYPEGVPRFWIPHSEEGSKDLRSASKNHLSYSAIAQALRKLLEKSEADAAGN